MIGTVRDRHQQRRVLTWTAAVSLAAGLVLFPLLAAFAPGGTYLAAFATGNIDRWNAGSELMYAADPEGARNLVYTSIMLQENAEAIQACRDAARQAGKRRRNARFPYRRQRENLCRKTWIFATAEPPESTHRGKFVSSSSNSRS